MQQPPAVSASLVQACPEARSTHQDTSQAPTNRGGHDIVQEEHHEEDKLLRKENSRLVLLPSLFMYS